MKLRFDFISNSSSSSFILQGDDVAKGIRLLKRVAEACEIPWEIENEISMHVHALNRNMRELSKILGEEYVESGYIYSSYRRSGERENPPDEISWHSIEISLSESGLERLTDETFDKIDNIEFYVGDGGNNNILLTLKMLYLFFQKNGCCPNALGSEQDFMAPNAVENFMYMLACGLTPENKKKGKMK